MRIGIFSECYLPTLNGVVVSIETFRKEMEKLGHEYFIFAPGTKDYKDEDKKHVFRYPSFVSPVKKDYPIAIPFFTNSIAKRIENLDLDIIHAQHFFTMGDLGLRMARKLGIPIIYTYHTLITEYAHYVPLPAFISKPLLISRSKNFCNACDQIVAPSPSMARILKSYGVETPITPIATGIDLESLSKPYPEKYIRAQWDIPENRRILLYLSRVAKEKNLDFLLNTFTKLLENRRKKHGRPDVHLIVAGGGPELNFYKQMAKKLRLDDYISFTDMLKKEVANRYFGAAHIFVFPSITETQGIVITEAMAAGTPVVAIDKMGPSDLVTDGQDGYLVGLNQNEFVRKVEKLLDDPYLHREMSRAAQKNAIEYSAKACAIKMEELYERTVEKYHRQGS